MEEEAEDEAEEEEAEDKEEEGYKDSEGEVEEVKTENEVEIEKGEEGEEGKRWKPKMKKRRKRRKMRWWCEGGGGVGRYEVNSKVFIERIKHARNMKLCSVDKIQEQLAEISSRL